MSKQLLHVVASRFHLQPALVSPSHSNMVVDALRMMATSDDADEDKAQEVARDALLAAYGYAPSATDKQFIYADGIAFIPVTGLLINRFNSSYGWVTGYNFIRAWLNAAVDDADVKLIVLDCNSGGGEVSGCFELCADILASRAVKPTLAVVDSASYSACYAIASSASRVVVTPSGGVGSVGVVAMHMDISKMLDEYGVKVTFIYSGDHKVDGNMYEPLPEPVRKSIQTRVDTTRQEFVSLVAGNRGLDAQVVFDTQAQCYSASEAIDLGLIDAIAPPLEAVQAFLIELSGSELEQETTMSATAAKPGVESTAAAPEEKKPAETATTTVASVDAATERKAERERISAITSHEAAKDKPALANHLALNTDLSVEAAAAILQAGAPEKTEPAAAAQTTSAFTAAMNGSEHPNVGADTADSGDTNLTAAQRILKSQSLATGMTH